MQPADFVFEGSNSGQLESYGFRLVCTELHGKKLKGKKIKTKVIMVHLKFVNKSCKEPEKGVRIENVFRSKQSDPLI